MNSEEKKNKKKQCYIFWSLKHTKLKFDAILRLNVSLSIAWISGPCILTEIILCLPDSVSKLPAAGVWTSEVGSIQAKKKKIHSSAYLQSPCWEVETGEASVGKWLASCKWVILFLKEKMNWKRHLSLISDLRVSHIHTGSIQNSLSLTHTNTHMHIPCAHAHMQACTHACTKKAILSRNTRAKPYL